MTLPPIDLEFLDEGSAIAVPSRVSTIAADLCVMALLVLAVWLGLVVSP